MIHSVPLINGAEYPRSPLLLVPEKSSSRSRRYPRRRRSAPAFQPVGLTRCWDGMWPRGALRAPEGGKATRFVGRNAMGFQGKLSWGWYRFIAVRRLPRSVVWTVHGFGGAPFEAMRLELGRRLEWSQRWAGQLGFAGVRRGGFRHLSVGDGIYLFPKLTLLRLIRCF